MNCQRTLASASSQDRLAVLPNDRQGTRTRSARGFYLVTSKFGHYVVSNNSRGQGVPKYHQVVKIAGS